ncbi:hypothetical protein NCAS_0B00650 [Naumovozyma castellii]|uniref:AMMECR1 domain-containing protein n=1 Tax=Naumovozyma castellii TaxID=27288 RepID=G0VB26_NAUCA|nr:hypothetical protein NCAS_0B00650 [Naumovozyma castellii CBS 4309]CCC68149.1 hypothetical protein NCAS_0B00650 [Naumovozyma castellii CBS 4309]
MGKESLASSPYAFYAFYELYKYLGLTAKRHTLNQVGEILYPDFKLNPKLITSLFITWKKQTKKYLQFADDDGYILRGCIGTFAKMPIDKGIERFSIIAATEDNRFPPVGEEEISKLKCCCNILQNFETIFSKNGDDKEGDIFNWELGVHGIELKFKYKGIHSSTFLPEVMIEQDWDKEDTFRNLIEKAGCERHVTEIMDNYEEYFIEVIRYEGRKSAISYKTFKKELSKLEE